MSSGRRTASSGSRRSQLVESGALAHADLEPTVAKIRELNEKLAEADEPTPDESDAQEADEPATPA